MIEFLPDKIKIDTNIDIRLKLTSNYEDIKFIIKNKHFLTSSLDQHNNIYKILLNKYEFITMETINKLLNRENNNDLTNDNKIIEIKNNIYTISDIPLIPMIQNNDNISFIKYINPYFNLLKNKNIGIIKYINNNNELEQYLTNMKNITKTVFICNKDNIITNNYNFDYIMVQYNNMIDNKDIKKFLANIDVLILEEFNIIPKEACIKNIYDLLITLIFSELCLSLNVSDFVILNSIPYTEPYNELIYYLSLMFEKLEYYPGEISYETSFLIFKKNKKTIDSNQILLNILKQYKKDDKSLGLNINTGTLNKIYCTNYNNNNITYNNNDNIMIKKILKINIPESYYKFIKKIIKFIKRKRNKYIIKYNYLKDYLSTKTGNLNLSKVKSILLSNIDKSIKLLEKNNIEINEIYLINKLPNTNDIVKDFFKNIPDHLLPKIKLSRDSIYSVSNFTVAQKTSKLIKSYFRDVDIIIDGTANIGGNTMNFAQNFRYVISNELNKDTYNNLKNNIEVLNYKNVEIYNKDIIILMKEKKFNSLKTCLYLDPPWSGVYYKLKDVQNLVLGNLNIVDWIKTVPIKYICLKVPKNYNFSYLFDNFNDIKIEKVIYCYLIFITKY